MIELLIQGGPVFTFPMTLIFLINIVLIARYGALLLGDKFENQQSAFQAIDVIKYIGIFLVTTGILGQLIGLYSAFAMIEQMGDINPGMLAGGLRISSITTLIGLVYFLISYGSWFILRIKAGKM
jgi:hypothetical protein